MALFGGVNTRTSLSTSRSKIPKTSDEAIPVKKVHTDKNREEYLNRMYTELVVNEKKLRNETGDQLCALALSFINRNRNEQTVFPPGIFSMTLHFYFDCEAEKLFIMGVMINDNVTIGRIPKQRIVYKKTISMVREARSAMYMKYVREYSTKQVDVPDFAKELSKNKRLWNSIKRAYRYNNGVSFVDQNLLDEQDRGYIETLVNIWLLMQDPGHLKRKYEFNTPFLSYTPRILSSDEEKIQVLSCTSCFRVDGVNDLCIYVFSKTGKKPDLGMKQSRDISNEYMLSEFLAPNKTKSILYGTRANTDDKSISVPDFTGSSAHIYLDTVYMRKILDDDGIWMLLDDTYTDPVFGYAEIQRIYHLLDQQKLGGQQREGVPPELAPSFAPNYFGKGKVTSYTKLEAETKWRQICTQSNPSEQNLDVLINIAEGFEIKTKSRNPKYICGLIDRQYEIEFGERARMREIRERTEQEQIKYGLETPSSFKEPKTSPKRSPKQSKKK
jgi:hypothetical protein